MNHIQKQCKSDTNIRETRKRSLTGHVKCVVCCPLVSSPGQETGEDSTVIGTGDIPDIQFAGVGVSRPRQGTAPNCVIVSFTVTIHPPSLRYELLKTLHADICWWICNRECVDFSSNNE